MLRRSAVTLVAGLLLALPCGNAFAAIIPRATLVANPPTTPFLATEAALPAPWQSYQLSLEATNGDYLGAIDVIINGPLHQRWDQTDSDAAIDPTPNGPPSDGSADSHLTAPAGSPFGLGPNETNSKSGSPLASDPGTREYGLGGLRGAWAILNPGTMIDLAYIVVREDQIRELDISVLSCPPNANCVNALRTADFFPPVPEPATITMIALAMLSAAGHRSRRR